MSDKMKKLPVRQSKKMDGTPVRKKVLEKLKKKSFAQDRPKMATFIMIIVNFLMDYILVGDAQNLNKGSIAVSAIITISVVYSLYVGDYNKGLYPSGGTDVPRFIKHKNRYVTIGWLVISLWGLVFIMAEPSVVSKFFPVLDDKYYQSQIVHILFMAPVMEEVTFRYLLYDRWLKQKYGWLPGFIIASLVFAMCHPVTNMHSFIIYWAPTVLFFLIYNEFGLYGSIAIHMIYNMMAI